ncbi:MAG TPA: GTPase Era [Acidimicrobiales bacterium]|nr:GTPase Era [Acidimicrobiales bacterium]
MRSGFVTLVGRPNVGKSTLVNTVLGTKVSIVSDKVQTTRTQVRGILNRPGAQMVIVDTPGVHKPRGPLGQRLNETSADASAGVDVVVLVLDATGPVGRGDRFVAERVPPGSVAVVNKIDAVPRAVVLQRLAEAAQLGLAEYFPVSATTGEGVDELVEGLLGRLPEGPAFYPDNVVADVPEAFWVAELVREQLLAITREEVPHSIACVVTEWEWPRVRCEVLVERESQKGIVIGRGGSVLKAVGTAVRQQLPPGAYLELFVKVDPDWQTRASSLARLGY